MTDFTGVPADAVTGGNITGPDRSSQVEAFFQGTGKNKIVEVIGGYNTATYSGGYLIGDAAVKIPYGTSIQGTGITARFYADIGSANPLFAINTDGNGNLIVQSGTNVGPGLGNAYYRDFVIHALKASETSDMALVPAFEVGDSSTFENIATHGLQTLVRSPGSLYLDQLTVRKCVVNRQPDGDKFAVDLGAVRRVGDGLVIDQLHVVYNPDSINRPRAVKVATARGASILNGINGDHEFVSCTSLRFSNFHGEGGKISFIGTHGVASDNVYWMHANLVRACTPLNVLRVPGAGSLVASNVKLERQMFAYEDGSPHFAYDTVQTNLFVETGCGFVQIEDCYCATLLGGISSSPVGKAGIKTGDAVFDAYSHFASVRSRYDVDRWLISGEHPALGRMSGDTYMFPYGLQPGVSGIDSAVGRWGLPTGKYFFRVVAWVDLPRRIGSTTANELSYDMVEGGGAARLFLDIGRGPKMLRVYIGTSSGSYDRYIDVPWVGGNYIGVQGDRVMGFAAQTRPAGPVDASSGVRVAQYALQPGDPTNTVAYGNVTVTNFLNALPGNGTWNRGDVVLWAKPTGGKRGHQRLTTGSTHVLNQDWIELSV
ncbi:hypothetical protein [Sphingomonas sp. VNH70]|uniref:hypothetical protein n=1 Tax=Sphingomonas silueang TaxID=3156617 RepID=UPI0032B44E4D